MFALFLNQTKRFVRLWSRLEIFFLASDWTTWFFIPFWIRQNVDMRDHNQTYCALVLACVTLSWDLSQVAPIFSPRSLIDSLLDCICVFVWSKGLRCDCFHKMPKKTTPSNSLVRMKDWSHKSILVFTYSLWCRYLST